MARYYIYGLQKSVWSQPICHTLNNVSIWRVNFDTLEVPGAQTGGIRRQIDMTKSSYIVPEPIFEGLMMCWVVPAKLACPPNSNVVQCVSDPQQH